SAVFAGRENVRVALDELLTGDCRHDRKRVLARAAAIETARTDLRCETPEQGTVLGRAIACRQHRPARSKGRGIGRALSPGDGDGARRERIALTRWLDQCHQFRAAWPVAKAVGR